MTSTMVSSLLAELGIRVADEGSDPYATITGAVAGAAAHVTPAAAGVLVDPDAPEVARMRALAVASAAVLRDDLASQLLGARLRRLGVRTVPVRRSGADLVLVA
jgi:hypothetical protein